MGDVNCGRKVLDGIDVQNDPVNFIDPEGRFLVCLTVYGIYVATPYVVATTTIIAYEVAPYAPAIIKFAEGFFYPGPASTVEGVYGGILKEFFDTTTGGPGHDIFDPDDIRNYIDKNSNGIPDYKESDSCGK